MFERMRARMALALIGGLGTKVSAAQQMVMTNLGIAPSMGDKYHDQANDGYIKNIIVFRAINLVAQSVASIPWGLLRGDTPIEKHPLLDLIAQPNPMQAQSEYMQQLVSFLLIGGNDFVERVGPDGGQTRELWNKRPDMMSVLGSPTGIPRGYKWTDGRTEFVWESDVLTGISDIRHIKMFHPLDQWYGLSPISAAATSIVQRNMGDEWNTALLKNSAKPSGALVYKPPKENAALTLGDEQFDRLKDQLDTVYSGAGASGLARPLLLDGGMEWVEIGMSPKDMDWINSKNTNSRDIAQAFGTPPMLLGIQGDATFANFKEARQALWEETVIPLVWHICREHSAWLGLEYGGDFSFVPLLDNIPAIAEKREMSRERLVAEVAGSLRTPNEAREELGLSPHIDESGSADKLYMSASLVPLEIADEPTVEEDPEDVNPEDVNPGDNGKDEDGMRRIRLSRLAYG